MSRFGTDITRQQDRPLKGRALMRRNSALRSARGQIFEPEKIEITDELRDFLNARILEGLREPPCTKTFDEIVEEALAEAAAGK